MDSGLLGDVNWWAVVVAGFVYFAVGGLWFMPWLFGDIWTRAIGWEPDPEFTPSPAMYLVPLATALVAATALALLAAATGAQGLGDGVVLGLVTGVGVGATVLLVSAHFDPITPKPMTWFGVMAGYHLVGLVAAASIVAVWR